jgi:hypothetical protein
MPGEGDTGGEVKMVSEKQYFNFFLKQLLNATAEIKSEYFHLPVDGSEKKIYRERVYCYELYHILRCKIELLFPYRLQGEVDKTGNTKIPKKLQRKKPDFVFHIPKTKDNLAVTEVKSIKNGNSKIITDIDKLKKFLDFGYHNAIMLIYGDDESKVNYARSEINSLPEKYSKRIILLWHKEPGKPAEVINHA